ncbi:hypothetical protein [Maricaulis sp. W15]|uniref:hypothetical protein n=1 Tax=Maricaulis sp. W15 TaxID=1772333 RepID=UPI000AB61EE4|nr:hypothetical protein [Maricaulis sp. W15]
MTIRPQKPTRPLIQAPAALRIGLPHLLFSRGKPQPAIDARHALYARLRELRLS